MPLRTWPMREEEGLVYTVHCSMHLVTAYVQAVGALHGFFVSSLLVLGYPHTAVWIHLLLPWAYHLDHIFIPHICSGGYLNLIKVFLGRSRQQEEFVYTTAGIYNGKIFILSPLSLSTGTFQRRSLTCRILITSLSQVQLTLPEWIQTWHGVPG